MYEKIKAIYNTGNLKATKNINGEYILEIADKNLMPEYYEEVFNKQLEAINERSEKALSGGCIDTSGNSGRYYCGNDGFANGVPGLSDPIFVDGKVVQSDTPLNRPSREELDKEFSETFIKIPSNMSFIKDEDGNLVNSVNETDISLKDLRFSETTMDGVSTVFQSSGKIKFLANKHLDHLPGIETKKGKLVTISMADGLPEFNMIKAIYASGNLKATKNQSGEYVLEIADQNLMSEYYEDVFNETTEALKIRTATSLLGRDCFDTSGSGTYMCSSNNWNASVKGVSGLKNPVLMDNEVVEYEKVIELYNSKIEDSENKLVTISNNIETLTNEIETINNQELHAQKQIKELNEQIELNKNSLITKNEEIIYFKEQLSPISIKLNDALDQKDQLTKVFNSEKNLIEEELITQEEINIKISSLKDEYEDNLDQLNKEIDIYDQQTTDINKSIELLKTDVDNLKNLEPELDTKLVKIYENMETVVNVKADLAIANAQRYGLNVNSSKIESIPMLDNKSIITLDGSSLFRIVETDALLDNKGEFNIPKGTLSVKGQVYTAGAVRPEKLFSVYDLGENNNSFQISFTEKAQDLISKNNTLQGGKQNFEGDTVGSWVLVNAATGEQMPNPITGHKGSVVCEQSTCGIDGDFGKQAASFGGMYVLENLADENGNVSGLCNDGDCKFNVETLVVLGKNNIENNIFDENGKGLFQDDFTQRQLNEIKSFGITSEQRINAVKYAEENNIDINALNIPGVTEDSINTQRLAVEFAKENNISINEIQNKEGAYVKFQTEDFKESISSTMTYSGEALSGGTSEIANQTFKVIDGQIVKKTAQEISQSIESSSEEITEVAQEAASEVAEAAKEVVAQVEEVAKEIAEVAQEAAQEVAKTASSVITGDDIKALSELANDALGSWVLVDANTGKEMVNPISGYSGGAVCTASVCGADGSFGKAAASFGGVYVLESLADPETGNVTSRCDSGDCQFNIND
jgi:predicted  nucleic acid-binding Zn-ribbon protein